MAKILDQGVDLGDPGPLQIRLLDRQADGERPDPVDRLLDLILELDVGGDQDDGGHAEVFESDPESALAPRFASEGLESARGDQIGVGVAGGGTSSLRLFIAD